MHYTSWLASTTLFTTSVSAFYPFNGNSNPENVNADILSSSDDTRAIADGRSPTIDIKRRRTNVGFPFVV
jgi:hypothetical protein